MGIKSYLFYLSKKGEHNQIYRSGVSKRLSQSDRSHVKFEQNIRIELEY